MEDFDELWDLSLKIRKILRKFYRKKLIKVSDLTRFSGLDKMSRFIETSLEAFTDMILDKFGNDKEFIVKNFPFEKFQEKFC